MVRIFLLALLLLVAAPLSATPILLIDLGSPEVESFDLLAKTGTANPPPPGWAWAFLEVGGSTPTTYATGTGSSGTGNTYSFGASDATDRAFGTLRSASVASTVGVAVLNQTGVMLTGLAIDFAGEQWRLGATGRVDRLDFAYSLDATSLATGAWTEVNALDFTAPVTTGTVGALNGNAATNRTAVSHTLTGLALAPGGTIWLRWADFDASGADDGLALDDFAIRALAPATPANVPEELPWGVSGTVLLGLLGLQRTRWSWRRA